MSSTARSSSRGPSRGAGSSRGRSSGDARAKAASAVKKQKAAKSQGFLNDLRFRNDLPLPPVDPRFIKIPQNAERLFKYHITSLEQNYKYRVHLEPAVGNAIHLIDPRTAEVRGTALAPQDKHILRRETDEVQEFFQSAFGQGTKKLSAFGNTMSLRNLGKSGKVRQGKHWLRKTEYIDNDQAVSMHNYATSSAENQKKLAQLEKEQKLIQGNIQRLTKTERIAKSFEVAKKDPVHHSNKSLKPVKIFKVLPSLELAAHALFQVNFIDENIMDDKNTSAGVSSSPKRKRGRVAVEYSEEQRRALEGSLLEEVNNDESTDGTLISLLIPASDFASGSLKKKSKQAVTTDKDGNASDSDKDSAFDDSDSDDEKENAGANAAGSSDQNGTSLKWVRDYEYRTQQFPPRTRYGLVWKKSSLSTQGTANDPVYSTVTFAKVEPVRLDMSRSQRDKYDIVATRKKRIKLERRELTEEEKESQKARETLIQEAGSHIGGGAAGSDDDEDSDDSSVEDKAQEQGTSGGDSTPDVAKVSKSVAFSDEADEKAEDEPSSSSSEEEEL